jgi:hypothetical protein
MGIYNPRVFLTNDDIELLGLMAALLLDCDNSQTYSNYPAGGAVLSQSEAHKLLILLEEFASSKKFVEGAYFVERLAGGADVYDPSIREIYLSWRKRQGRSRAMASVHWRNFINRLGVVRERSGYLTGGHLIQAERMELDYFIKMERKLLSSTGLKPRVVELLMSFVEARTQALEKIRDRDYRQNQISLKTPLNEIIHKIRSSRNKMDSTPPLSANQISAVMIIVADFSVLFTTRDWDVCGTMSSIAGAIPHSAGLP